MKLRVKFSKHGAMKFIGHLDVMRYFQKVMRRADIDVTYSEGFSPHQKMSFAQPLGVGLTSDGEYFDIELNSLKPLGDKTAPDFTAETLKQKLNEVSAIDILVTDIVLLPEGAGKAMAEVCGADYTVRSLDTSLDLISACERFNKADTVKIEKETKKSVKEIDLKDFVYKLDATDKSTIKMRLCAGSGTNIKPTLLLKTLYEMNGISYPEERSAFEINRVDLLNKYMKSLSSDGKIF
ncbi:MAG: TIGR03936 family radical SAM-associated protein [Lachnospiraceae bacterium]|nr:TIGR03936 family radical SAM-associated protein [Lachnospiraceae bacterium]